MIEEPAQIVAVEGQWAWLETQRSGSCSSCSARSGCGISLIEKVAKPRLEQIWALNRAQAKVGDQVIVGIAEQALLRGSATLYLSPLIGLFAGAALAEALAPFNSLLATEPSSILFGLVGLGAGLYYLRQYSRKRRDDPRYQPVVLRTEADTGFHPVAMPAVMDDHKQ
jgi:sigma-E factor negative regulatory protein RseC